MVKLTKCEKMVYDAMLAVPHSMSLEGAVELVNCAYDKNWSSKAVRVFLERLILVNCAKKHLRNWKWYYEIIENEVKVKEE